jgi:hypothetical protein
VDPTKFDFYAMDCYRTLANNKMAETLADEVIQASTDFDGRGAMLETCGSNSRAGRTSGRTFPVIE